MNNIPKTLRAQDVRRPTQVRLLGSDARQPANDEPDTAGDLTEADLAAIDAEFAASKRADPFRQNDADRAMREEVRRAPGHWR